MKPKQEHIDLVLNNRNNETPVRVMYESGPYNPRRYSKPWIAKITAWPVGDYPQLQFGVNVGSEIAEISANIGDVLKLGQKDYRRPRGTINEFILVTSAAGDYARVTPAQARELYDLKTQSNEPMREDWILDAHL